jgi:hypothetical protein
MLCNRPRSGFGSIEDSVVIVNGDFRGAARVRNCLLIVRGNVGQIATVQNSIILATGKFEGGTGGENSFFQAGTTVTITSPSRRDNAFLILETERGPLQLLKFASSFEDEPGFLRK